MSLTKTKTKTGAEEQLENKEDFALPSLREVRKGFSEQDFRNYQEAEARARRLEREDPLAFYEGLKQECLDELNRTGNHYRRGQLLVMLDQLEVSIESARKLSLQRELMAKDQQFAVESAKLDLEKAALQKGPLWTQKIWWRASEIFSGFRSSLNFVPRAFSRIWSWYKKHCRRIAVWFVRTTVLHSLVYLFYTGLGLNFIFSVLLLAVLSVISFSSSLFTHDYGPKNNLVAKPLYTIFLLLALGMGQTALVTWKCVAPLKGYAYVIQSGEKIVEVIDSSLVFWVPPPRFWRGERLRLVDITNNPPGANTHSPSPELFKEELRHQVGVFQGKPVFVNMVAEKTVISSGLRLMVEKKTEPAFYRADIQRQINEAIDGFVAYKDAATALPELASRISVIKNDVFGLTNVRVWVDF